MDAGGRVVPVNAGPEQTPEGPRGPRTEAAARFLDEATSLLLRDTLDAEETLRLAARLATRELADYANAEIFEANEARRVAMAHADPSKRDLIRAYEARYPPKPQLRAAIAALPPHGVLLLNDLAPELARATFQDAEEETLVRALGLRHHLAVPLRTRSGIVGALGFTRSEGRPFDEADVALAKELAQRAGLAFENARLHASAREQEARWRSLMENAPDYIYLADREGRILFINRARPGRAVGDIVGKTLYEWLSKAEADHVRPVMEGVFRDGKPASFRTSAAIAGEMRHYECRVAPVVRDGEVTSVTVSTSDITTRVRQEQEIEEQSRTLATLHAVAGTIAAELDLERAVQAATDAATSVTGAAFGAFFYNVVNERGEEYSLYALSGVPREAFARFPMPRNTAVFAPTFRGEGTVRSDDITADPRYGHSAPHYGMPRGHLPVRSYLAVPVRSRDGRVLGGIFLGHPEAARFSAAHERLAEGLAAHAATALDNAHLYRAARLAEARLRDVFENAPVQIVTIDARGRIESVNRQLSGVPLDQVIGKSVFDLVPEAERERVHPLLRRVFEQGEAVEYEIVLPTPDGPTWRQVRVAPMHGGRPDSGVILLSMDITGRVRAEEALRESEQRFRALVTATTHMVWSTDRDGKIVDMPEWRRFTGQSVEEVAGDGWVGAIHPEDRARVYASWTAAFEARGPYEAEYRVRSRMGEYRHFVARGVPRLDPRGELIEYIGTWTDVTPQRVALQEAEALRAQLARSEKLSALGSLVGGVAHEIRTPLTYLQNSLALLELGVRRSVGELPAERAHELRTLADARLADAYEGVARIARLVEDLRRFTKVRPGTERVAARLDPLVREAVDIFRATHRGQVVLEEALASSATVRADRVQLQQVVLNLLQNGFEARPGDAWLRVATRDAPEGAVVEVEDRAGGIPDEVRLRMWDPFYTTKPEGTGLGLSIVKRILDEHGARIEVDARVGAGTTFRIVLPRAP